MTKDEEKAVETHTPKSCFQREKENQKEETTPLVCFVPKTPVSQCICSEESPQLTLFFVLPEAALIAEWL